MTDDRDECPWCGDTHPTEQATGYSAEHDECRWLVCESCGCEWGYKYDNSTCPGDDCPVHGER